MVINCEIKFDQNPYGIYFAGQTLSGRAELRLDKPKKVKGLCLKIAGYAFTNWVESHSSGSGSNRKTQSITYVGREDYIWTTTYFLGSEEGNQLELSTGQHSYSFSCALPPMLPTSYEGTYGHIRYTVRLVLERPWKFDQSYKVAFTVLKPFDLNYDSPILRIPSQMELTKNFCCGPCRTGPFSILASIPQSGFVSGQIIKVSAEVTNMSTIPVDEMKFFLRKIVAYHSQTPTSKTKEEIVNIQERRTGGVAKRDHGRFLVSLPVPPVPPTNINLCKVIHITYEVKVEAKLSGLYANPYIRIPITIGTIPLNHNNPDPKNPIINTISANQPPIMIQPMSTAGLNERQYHDQYSNDEGIVKTIAGQTSGGVNVTNTSIVIPNQMEMIPTVASSSVDYSNRTPITNPINNAGSMSMQQEMPPPSYEETMGGNRRIENEEDQHPLGQQLYVPRYPVYHFNEAGILRMINEDPSPAQPADDQRRQISHPEKILEKIDSMH